MAKGLKTGGRTKGSRNKLTLRFQERLAELNFSIPDAAKKLYEDVERINDYDNPTAPYALKLRVLEFLAQYTCSKPRPTQEENGDEKDVTPGGDDEEIIDIPTQSLLGALKQNAPNKTSHSK